MKCSQTGAVTTVIQVIFNVNLPKKALEHKKKRWQRDCNSLATICRDYSEPFKS